MFPFFALTICIKVKMTKIQRLDEKISFLCIESDLFRKNLSIYGKL